MTKKFDREQLLVVAKNSAVHNDCPVCSGLLCPGWISVPGYFGLDKLQVLGTLKTEGAEESWDEYHPNGTHLWSDNAPIALQHHPYNRSDILACSFCKKVFLHYTEYGGYYLEERIRELNAEFIV